MDLWTSRQCLKLNLNTAHSFNRGTKCFFNTPSTLRNPRLNNSIAHIVLFTHLHQAKCITSKGHHFIGALVALLLRACRPSTIIRPVTPIVVDSVNGVSGRWAFAHVLQKVLKSLPFITQVYPASTVVLGVLIIHVCGTCLHVCPTAISSSETQSVRFQPNPINRSGSFSADTSTGTRRPSFAPKVCSSNNSNIATVAFTKPIWGPSASANVLNNFKSIHPHSNKGLFWLPPNRRIQGMVDNSFANYTFVLGHLIHEVAWIGCSSGSQTASTAGSRAIYTTTPARSQTS